ncbi:hypothetical protein GCM10022240_04910 [Microbacterium kribbense]|uniref:SbsA Ig-like domain-containing protein n=1 Tax=Microbacterium kribbense TaxID=433645 RepID=A0ABP7G3R4_9MICO
MSTDGPVTRRAYARRRRGRAFIGAFTAVLGVLAVLGLAGAAVGSAQGPRVTAVHVDPVAAASASGARLIVTMNQSLHTLKPEQVHITPATPFTVDTSGRGMGVRFTLPLYDDTEYTVRFTDVTGLGGGPAARVTQTFRTPALAVYLLQRNPVGDSILRTDLTGSDPVPVLRADHIEDFRATSGHLVVSTLAATGAARLIVTDLDGRHARDLPLPGRGTIAGLQTADRGELIGYTFSDADLGRGGTRESRLYVASVKDAAARTAPVAVDVPGTEKRVADWRFVPDSDSILVLTYDGRTLLSGATGADPTQLGTGAAIDGIARGSSVAVIQRTTEIVAIDLSDGTESDLVTATADGRAVPGHLGQVIPIPGTTGASVRPYTVLDVAGGSGGGQGVPDGTTVFRVDDDGAATPLLRLPPSDALLQTCISPSGRYAALTIAPETVTNTYDDYLMPMPTTVRTRIVQLADGAPVHTFSGFGISWCQVPPPLSQ